MPLALSVQQPWAWAIVSGAYLTEQRFYGFDYRGELYIHASKSKWRIEEGHRISDMVKGVKCPESYDYGAIIGKVELYDSVTLEEFKKKYAKQFSYSRRVVGPFVLMMRNPIAIPPVPLSGKRKLFRFDASVLDHVGNQKERMLF